MVSLFGICFRGPINFGSTSYLTSTPLAPRYSITPLLRLATWNSIIKAKNILKNGFSWRAGSGESSFWYSHWTYFGPLCANVPYVHINDIALKINEVYATIPPNLNMLHTFLPSDILDEIIDLKLHLNSNTKDTFIWNENSNESIQPKLAFPGF